MDRTNLTIESWVVEQVHWKENQIEKLKVTKENQIA